MIEVLDSSVDEVLQTCDRAQGADGEADTRRMVDALDRAAAARKREVADARRVLAGRAALRLLVAARLGHDPAHAAEIRIERVCETCGGPHGRPRLPGLSMSSSTSGDRVLAAVSQENADVGVDLERVPESIFSGFDDFVLHPAERGRFAGRPGDIDGRIDIWVEKEAVLKSSGLGLTSLMEALRVDAAHEVSKGSESSPGWRSVLEGGTPGLVGLVVTSLPAAPGYRSALATRIPHDVRMVDINDVWP